MNKFIVTCKNCKSENTKVDTKSVYYDDNSDVKDVYLLCLDCGIKEFIA
jgi:RNase P subunit RPR2